MGGSCGPIAREDACDAHDFSDEFQCGKGALYIDLMGYILGKYYNVPTAPIDSEDGLLGRFNDNHKQKALIVLDENGEKKKTPRNAMGSFDPIWSHRKSITKSATISRFG